MNISSIKNNINILLKQPVFVFIILIKIIILVLFSSEYMNELFIPFVRYFISHSFIVTFTLPII